MVRKLRFIRSRMRWMRTESVDPSAPQFRLALSEVPSRLSSPLASLCRSSKLTRSVRVNPSWQVTKLTLA